MNKEEYSALSMAKWCQFAISWDGTGIERDYLNYWLYSLLTSNFICEISKKSLFLIYKESLCNTADEKDFEQFFKKSI